MYYRQSRRSACVKDRERVIAPALAGEPDFAIMTRLFLQEPNLPRQTRLAALLGALLVAASPTLAAPQGNEHWRISPARCDEVRAAWPGLIDKYRGKLSVKFPAIMIAFMASNCIRQAIVELDGSKLDRKAYEELLAILKV